MKPSNKPLLLAIDTAGPACSAGFFDAERALAVASEDIGRGHAERLIPMIEELRSGLGVPLCDITQVAVTVGPGSFTGLRVGLAAARGFALALNCACTGVTVFEALHHAYCDGKPLGIALDAKRGQVWWQAFDGNGTAACARQAEPKSGDPIRLLGNGADLVAGPQSLVVSRVASAPIEAVAAVALAHPDRAATPLYLRAPDAKPQALLQKSSSAQKAAV